MIEAIGAILSRNRGQRKETMAKQGRCRTGKDVVKVLENGSSVAVHAESHVAWILLVGGNNFFPGGRAISTSLSGERAKADAGELLLRNAVNSPRLFFVRFSNTKKKNLLVSHRLAFLYVFHLLFPPPITKFSLNNDYPYSCYQEISFKIL